MASSLSALGGSCRMGKPVIDVMGLSVVTMSVAREQEPATDRDFAAEKETHIFRLSVPHISESPCKRSRLPKEIPPFTQRSCIHSAVTTALSGKCYTSEALRIGALSQRCV